MINLTRVIATGSYAASNILRKQMFAKSAQNEPALQKLKKLQELFQKDNGLPVFLKGGSGDKTLYRVTMGLAVIGILLNVKLFIDLALGKHQRQS